MADCSQLPNLRGPGSPAGNHILKLCTANEVVSRRLKTCLIVTISGNQALHSAVQWESSKKKNFRIFSIATLFITLRAPISKGKAPNIFKQEKNKIRYVSNKLHFGNTGRSTAKQYASPQLPRDMDHVPLCVIIFGRFFFSAGGKRWLMGISVI